MDEGARAARAGGSLRGASVLVTGATGFIGSHLARRLGSVEGARVTGTGRSLGKARFLERDGVELTRHDIRDADRARELVRDRDVVFHAAAWMRGDAGRGDDARRAHEVNVEATGELVRAAAEAGVRRVVHVSSIGAYGPPRDGPVPEDTPLATRAGDLYGRTKALGELRAREVASERGVEIAVVRPAFVYGPRSGGWTRRIHELVCGGTPVLVGDGSGHFYPLYVDNLVDLLLLCATRPEAAGEAFNASEPPVTWREYAGRYGRLCGREPRAIPLWLARLVAAASSLPGLRLPLDRKRLAWARSRASYPTEKARGLLGWEPRVDLDEGIARSAEWLREEGLL